MFGSSTREEAAGAPREHLPQSGKGLPAWQVRRAVNYMKSRLEDGLSLAEAAATIGLSGPHFCTAFRLATGLTPLRWFKMLRIERARELLMNPTVPIIDVSLAVGYQTPSAFTCSFRRMTGMTPTEFRKVKVMDSLQRSFDRVGELRPAMSSLTPSATRGAGA